MKNFFKTNLADGGLEQLKKIKCAITVQVYKMKRVIFRVKLNGTEPMFFNPSSAENCVLMFQCPIHALRFEFEFIKAVKK